MKAFILMQNNINDARIVGVFSTYEKAERRKQAHEEHQKATEACLAEAENHREECPHEISFNETLRKVWVDAYPVRRAREIKSMDHCYSCDAAFTWFKGTCDMLGLPRPEKISDIDTQPDGAPTFEIEEHHMDGGE